MKSSLRLLFKSPKFIFGFAILFIVFGVIIVYPFMNTCDPFEMVGMSFQPPSAEYLMGTDNFGRDVFLELAYGARTSMFIGFLGGVVATAIGLILGLSSGYLGGLVDNIISAVTNMFIVIPSFIILILISMGLSSRSSVIIAIVIGFTSWPWTTRAVRAQATSLRNRDHVNIAKISGYSTPKIIVYEILPYIASYVVMAFIMQVSSGILAEAGISMLGLGPFNTITLGTMLNWAMMFEAPSAGAWWAFIPPALTIASITFALLFINTCMDEIFNPKIRS